jgi:hypothetical protein
VPPTSSQVSTFRQGNNGIRGVKLGPVNWGSNYGADWGPNCGGCTATSSVTAYCHASSAYSNPRSNCGRVPIISGDARQPQVLHIDFTQQCVLWHRISALQESGVLRDPDDIHAVHLPNRDMSVNTMHSRPMEDPDRLSGAAR